MARSRLHYGGQDQMLTIRPSGYGASWPWRVDGLGPLHAWDIPWERIRLRCRAEYPPQTP